MPPVDFQPGRAASGLGGGDNGGWEPDRGHGKEVTRSHEKKELKRTRDMTWATENSPIRHSIQWRGRERPKTLGNNQSHFPALVIQLYGQQNKKSRQCLHCKNGNGKFEGCHSFRHGQGPQGGRAKGMKSTESTKPYTAFGGACGNCWWGSQGSRCTLRPDGPKFAPRKIRPGRLCQDAERSDTQMGKRFDLNTKGGVQAAARDLRSLILALNNREKLGDAKNWQDMETVLSEADSSDEEASEEEMEYSGEESPNVGSEEGDVEEAEGKEMAKEEANSGS
ncbi:hypothetical protein BGZ60DRAFT_429434 [Tricladium varicosporioides]|nr:hypothetical protein BGZ60DRAFT_429434 [Hymenoscyphus varicosporioides]